MAIELTRNVQHGEVDGNLKICNSEVELLLPTRYGPRVARYATRSGPNLFAEVSPREQRVETAFGEAWHIYGGHRLWIAPEHPIDSYYPDNRELRVEADASRVTLIEPVEPHTKLEKTISVQLYERGSRVSVQHTLKNCGTDVCAVAPWALSAMAPGGVGVFPQAPFMPHPQALAPARPLVLWPFTRMNDPRSTWGDRFILLRQDKARSQPQKFGFYNDRGYMAYQLGRQLFIKCHLPTPGRHVDYGCNAQTFTNELFLELETLGPEVALAPGQHVSHREEWFLLNDVELPLEEPAIGGAMQRALRTVLDELARTADQPELSRLLQESL